MHRTIIRRHKRKGKTVRRHKRKTKGRKKFRKARKKLFGLISDEEREIRERTEMLLMGSDTLTPQLAREKVIEELNEEGKDIET